MFDTAGVDEVDIDVLVEKEKPVVAFVVPEEAVLLVTLKPEKALEVVAVLAILKPENDPPLLEAAELPGIAVETVLIEEAVGPNAGTEEDCVVLLEAGVEAVVVVTVENTDGAAVVDREKEVGFVACVLETSAPDEATLPNPKED